MTDPDIVTGSEEPWHEAATEVDYQWSLLSRATTLTSQGEAAIALASAVHDLRTFLPGYDYRTGTLAWEREQE